MIRLKSILLNLLFIGIAGGWSGCNLINPDEAIPAYIEVRGITTTSNYTTQGSASSKITDVWVYAGGEYLGTFELPARIPILLEGKHKITFGAGIKANGISSTSEFYNLYKFHDVELDLIPGKVTVVDTFSVSYFPALQYTWYEDFEKDTSGGGISLDTTYLSLAEIYPDSVEVFEGRRSLRMQVTTAFNFIECRTVGDGFVLPVGRDVYIEMDYKCSQPFIVGLIGVTNNGEKQIPIIRLNPKSDWNKIYIRLGPYVNYNSDAFKFKVYFRVALPSTLTEGTVYLDNLKLISN
ncbi:MAG: hypothetical protein IPO63_07305 [Bacteroidetes bacterium]|nr:hypothetical protein [Bacteroidota bacterium]